MRVLPTSTLLVVTNVWVVPPIPTSPFYSLALFECFFPSTEVKAVAFVPLFAKPVTYHNDTHNLF